MIRPIIFCFIWLLLGCISCTLFRSNEDTELKVSTKLYAGFMPNQELLSGTYIKELSPDHDTLILVSGMVKKIFFLFTKDSFDNSVIIRGVWGYYARGSDDFSDGYGSLGLESEGYLTCWGSKVDYQDDKSLKGNEKLLVIDTLRWSNRPSKYSKGITIDTLSWVHKPAENSKGIPFRFVKRITTY